MAAKWPDKDIYTAGEAARLCGVSPRTLALWVDGGVLPGYRLPVARGFRGPGDRRITRESLVQFLRDSGMHCRLPLPAAALVVAPPWSPLRAEAFYETDTPFVFAADPWQAAELAARHDVRGVAIDRAALGYDLALVAFVRACALPGTPPLLMLIGEDDTNYWASTGATVLRQPCDPALVARWRAGLGEGGAGC